MAPDAPCFGEGLRRLDQFVLDSLVMALLPRGFDEKIVYRNRFENDRPFEREFEGIQKFEPISRSHESQVDILQVGRAAGYFYCVMELADDAHAESRKPKSEIRNWETYVPRTLKYELQERGRLPPGECLRLALSLTTALEPLHRHGLILLRAGKSLKRARWLEQRLALATRAGLSAALMALVAAGFLFQAKRAERKSEEQVHRMYVAQGVRSMDEGDLHGAVRWFAQALAVGHRDSPQTAVNRLRIGTTLGFCPTLAQMVFHQGLIRRAVFSPDGKRFATASEDGTARIWELATGQPITPPLQHQADVRDVEFMSC